MTRLGKRAVVLAVSLALAGSAMLAAAGRRLAPPGSSGAPRVVAPRVVVVAMHDAAGVYRFRPAHVRARRGDRLRFVLAGRAAHNVEFPDLSIGPYVTRRDQSYEISLDHRFPDGVYPFHCAPHEPFGMRGTLVVEGAAAP